MFLLPFLGKALLLVLSLPSPGTDSKNADQQETEGSVCPAFAGCENRTFLATNSVPTTCLGLGGLSACSSESCSSESCASESCSSDERSSEIRSDEGWWNRLIPTDADPRTAADAPCDREDCDRCEEEIVEVESAGDLEQVVSALIGAFRPVAVVFEGEPGYCVIERSSETGDFFVSLLPKSEMNTASPAPRRLPLAVESTGFDPELREIQRACREASTRGDDEKVLEIAKAFGGEGKSAHRLPEPVECPSHRGQPTDSGTSRDPRFRRAFLTDDSGPTHYQVGYQASTDQRGDIDRFEETPWNKVRSQPVTCHFNNATLSDVATFFRHATGLEVSVAPLPLDAERITVTCRERTVEQALRVALGSIGQGYAVDGNQLLIAPPSVLDRLDLSASIERWVP